MIMEKKKVFYLLTSMHIGGTEKALLGLLSTIDYARTEVHLGLFHKEGGFLDYIPGQVLIHAISLNPELLGEDNLPTTGSVRYYFRRGQIIKALCFSVLYLLSIFSKRYRASMFRFVLKDEPVFPIHFDEAYAFSGINELVTFYVAEKVKADKKVCWIHFDVAKEYVDKSFFIRQMSHYQKIYLVSKQAKQSFDTVFPALASKSEFHYNIVPAEHIKELSEVGQSFEDGYAGIRLLTIARMSSEKGIEDALHALKELIQKGIRVRWYFIGDGPRMDQYRQLSRELALQDDTVFLGSIVNPYRFLKECDIYIQPSRGEGYCIAIAEARCLDKPIVATDFAGAREQLTGRDNSFIVGVHAQSLPEGIHKMIRKLGQA